MHLDARAGAVEERNVAPVVHVEVGVQHAVYVPQQVQVEGGGQMQRVVVGGFQDVLGLDAVHAHQQSAAGALFTDPPQHGVRVLGTEIADAGPRIEKQSLFGRDPGGQGQFVGEILSDGGDLQVGIRKLQAAHRSLQVVRGDVDRHIVARPQAGKEAFGLDAVARAQIYHR